MPRSPSGAALSSRGENEHKGKRRGLRSAGVSGHGHGSSGRSPDMGSRGKVVSGAKRPAASVVTDVLPPRRTKQRRLSGSDDAAAGNGDAAATAAATPGSPRASPRRRAASRANGTLAAQAPAPALPLSTVSSADSAAAGAGPAPTAVTAPGANSGAPVAGDAGDAGDASGSTVDGTIGAMATVTGASQPPEVLLALRATLAARLASVERRFATVNSTLRKNALGVGTGVGAARLRQRDSKRAHARARTGRARSAEFAATLDRRREKRRMLQLVRLATRAPVDAPPVGPGHRAAVLPGAEPRRAGKARLHRHGSRSAWRTKVHAWHPVHIGVARSSLVTSCVVYLLRQAPHTREHLRREVRRYLTRLDEATAAPAPIASPAAGWSAPGPVVGPVSAGHPCLGCERVDVEALMALFDPTFAMLEVTGVVELVPPLPVVVAAGSAGTAAAQEPMLATWRICEAQDSVLGSVEQHISTLAQLRQLKVQLAGQEVALRQSCGPASGQASRTPSPGADGTNVAMSPASWEPTRVVSGTGSSAGRTRAGRGPVLPTTGYGTEHPQLELPLFTQGGFCDQVERLPWASVGSVLAAAPTVAAKAPLPAAVDLTVATANAASKRFAEAAALPAPVTVPMPWRDVSCKFETVREGSKNGTRRPAPSPGRSPASSAAGSSHRAVSAQASPVSPSSPATPFRGSPNSAGSSFSPRSPASSWRQQYVRQAQLLSPNTAVAVASSAVARASVAASAATARVSLTPYRPGVAQVHAVTAGNGAGGNAGSIPAYNGSTALARAASAASYRGAAGVGTSGADQRTTINRSPTSSVTSAASSVVITPSFRAVPLPTPAKPFTRPTSAWDTFDADAPRAAESPKPVQPASAGGAKAKAPSLGKSGKKSKSKPRRKQSPRGRSSTETSSEEDTDDDSFRRRHERGSNELKRLLLLAHKNVQRGPNWKPRPPPRQRGPVPPKPRGRRSPGRASPCSTGSAGKTRPRTASSVGSAPASPRLAASFRLSAAPRSRAHSGGGLTHPEAVGVAVAAAPAAVASHRSPRTRSGQSPRTSSRATASRVPSPRVPTAVKVAAAKVRTSPKATLTHANGHDGRAQGLGEQRRKRNGNGNAPHVASS